MAATSSCRTVEKKSSSWNEHFEEQLSLLGHRNWIMIADSAYPLQTSSGIEMIYTGEDHFTLLQQVARHLNTRNHIAGQYYLDAEMQHLEETQAPGIDDLRQAIAHQLENELVRHLPHATLMEKLSQAGKDYRVLILKSEGTLPYSSIFIELDCGYWGTDQERKLRKKMP